jgi:protein kinase A
MTSFTHAFL